MHDKYSLLLLLLDAKEPFVKQMFMPTLNGNDRFSLLHLLWRFQTSVHWCYWGGGNIEKERVRGRTRGDNRSCPLSAMVTVTVTAGGMGARGWKLGDSWKDWRSPPSSYPSLCQCFSLHGPQIAEVPPPLPWQLLIMGSCQGHQFSHPLTIRLLISFFLVLRNSFSMLFRVLYALQWHQSQDTNWN